MSLTPKFIPEIKTIVIGVSVLIILYYVFLNNYLLFHVLVEGFSVIVAVLIYVLGTRTFKLSGNTFLLFMGISHVLTGLFNLLHIGTYPGMGIFNIYGRGASGYLSVSCSFINAKSFLVAPFFIERKYFRAWVLYVYGLICLLLIASIFWVEVYRSVPNASHIQYRMVGELIVSVVALSAIFHFYRCKNSIYKPLFLTIMGSLVLLILSCLSFALSISGNIFSYYVKHILQMASYYLIYRAFIILGLDEPLNTIFEKLSKSESRFRLLAENARDIIYRYQLEPQLGFEYISPACEKITGYTPENFYDDPGLMLKIADPEDFSLESFPPSTFDAPIILRMKHRDGSVVYTEQYIVPFYDKDRNLVAIEGIGRDVTDRKRAEHDLHVSEDRFFKAFNASPNPMSITTLEEGRYIEVNESFKRISGYSREELIGRTVAELEIWEYAGRRSVLINRLLMDGSFQNYETYYMSKSGSRRYVLLSAVLIEINSQKYILGVLNDITERKQAEEALKKSEELYRMLAENVRDIIWTANAKLEFTYVSPSVQWVLGYDPEEALILSIKKVLTPDSYEVARTIFNKEALCRRAAGEYTLELEHVRKDGFTLWMEVKIVAICDSKNRFSGILGVTRDITRRKMAEEKVRIYQEQLRSLAADLSLAEERERRRIATEIHDYIGQSLAISKIKLGMLQNKLKSVDMEKNIGEIRSLIEEAIQFTRSLTFELSPPVLYELGFLSALSWLCEKVQERSGIVFMVSGKGQPRPLDDKVSIILFKVVRELFINIEKHSGATYAQVFLEWRESSIYISIEDNGAGFDINSYGWELSEAGGYGLFSIRERLKHLGGDLKVESFIGEGTRISLNTPLKIK